jgi:F0F1-type ATP synthase membrane subunit b/b'
MNFFTQLGINHTYFYQLFIFIITLVILSQQVFKPFAELLAQREAKSTGTEGLAAEENKKAAELRGAYEDTARSLSGDIKLIFDSYRQQASSEYETIVSKARQESMQLVEETRQRVSSEVGDAAKHLKEEAPLVAQAISSKLIANASGAKIE